MSEVYLLDGSCFVFRAYHAIKGLSTSKGIPTNAVYGFTRMLLKLIKERKVQNLLIAFDSPHPTKRHLVYEEYKITRPETPQDLPLQLEYIKEIIDAFGIKRFEAPGYEADDIIATIALKIEPLVYVVTLDKDMLQLVSDRVKIYDPLNDLIIDRDFVLKKYSLPPEKLVDFMALVGDSIDNIPGVKGIGEKTAIELLRRYGSVEEILKNLPILKPPRVAKLIKENIESLKLSKELVKLNLQVPIDLSLEEMEIRDWNKKKLIEIFQKLEFTSLIKEVLSKEEIQKEANLQRTHESNLTKDMEEHEKFALFTLGDKIIVGKENTFQQLSLKDSNLREILNSDRLKIFFDAKELFKKFIEVGLTISPPYFDLSVASYLINPNRGKYDFNTITLEYLGKIYDESLGLNHRLNLMFELYERLKSILKDRQLEELYFNIEMPLIEVLSHMEISGLKINLDKLEDLKEQIGTELEKIKSRIYLLSGKPFNINSPKQLSEILYDKLKLKSIKRGKKARSTEMEVLEELALQHELPQEVINFRILNKLLTGYLQPLKDYINKKTGRIHCKWSQTVAGTGRLISSEPNLQNIPVKGQWAELLREVFIPEEGFLFLSADYSQIELRILAHLSEDPSLIEAFKQGKDIHKRTAMELFSLREEEVTEEHRRIAKTVNFGISYGISSFGLSESIKIPYERAQELIDLYFLRYAKVKEFIENTIAFAKKEGYVRTLFGRIRPVGDINSPNQFLMKQAERVAVNSVVQGSAADIIKIAMIRIYERIKKENLWAKMVLQIHDEIVLEVVEREVEKLKEIVREEMLNFTLKVPLDINIHIGKTLNI